MVNQLTPQQKAHVLLESLSYIKTFHKQIVVIKYGGNAMINNQLKECVIRDIALLKYIGINPVIVHGGGPEINELMTLYKKKPEFINGLRVTDEEAMKITEMVLTGKIAPEIVSLFSNHDIKALGLSGKDGNIIKAKQKSEELGLVGEITSINPELILSVIEKGYVPVISPIGIGETGESYNINADEVAGKIAISLNAKKLILITDVAGVLENHQDPNTVISALNINEAYSYIKKGIIKGGMIPKMFCCLNAVSNGVEKCHIIDGRQFHSILLEVFTDTGIGTMITA